MQAARGDLGLRGKEELVVVVVVVVVGVGVEVEVYMGEEEDTSTIMKQDDIPANTK